MGNLKGVLFLLTVLATPAFASEYAAQSLQGVRMGACASWVYNSGGNMPGWICSGHPTQVVVAEAYAYAEVIRALEKRVAELEKQLTEMKEGRAAE